MKRKIAIAIFLVFQYCPNNWIMAQDSTKADWLKDDEDAVVLRDDVIMRVFNENSAEYDIKVAILVKNKDGDEYGRVVMRESNFREITNISAVIKDTLGNVLKELQSEDIEEMEYSFGSVFYSGKLYKFFTLNYHTYPYIIEYEYTNELNTLFLWPDWYPQWRVPNYSSTYKLILEEPVNFNYYQVGLDVKPVMKIEDSDTVYTWSLQNIPAKKKEDFMPPGSKVQKAILFTPQKFSVDDYAGRTDSWDSLARWFSNLYSGRTKLPEQASNEIAELIDSVNDPLEKIDILYNYLQEKNRYVAVEMGIRGWRPQSAEEVYQNRFGDCKDLTTFMIAMLREAGIEAYPALALTRTEGDVYSKFPSNQFNHCITFIPMKEDTIWLECTADNMCVGEIPYNIENIDVLVVKDNGGELIKTPIKKASQNLSVTNMQGVLNEVGNLQVNISLTSTGNRKNYLNQNLVAKNQEEDITFLQNYFNDFHTNLRIKEYSSRIKNNTTRDLILEVNGSFNRFSPKRGKRIFINPAVFNRITSDDRPDETIEEREFPVFHYYPYIEIDTISVSVPGNFKVDYIPENKDYSFSFGNYKSEYSFESGKIHYMRRFEISQSIIPVENYEEYLDFINKAMKADKAKYIFLKE